MPARFASSTGRTSARASSGASTMRADALALEALDDLDLLLAIVLAERALPHHPGVDSLRLQLALGLDRAGVDGLQNSCVVPFGMTAIW